MATTEVVLPELGTGVSSGELVAWLVEPGDRVADGQTIAEIETDKSVVEIPAPASGIVAELRADPGDDLDEGAVVAVLDVEEGGTDVGDGTTAEEDVTDVEGGVTVVEDEGGAAAGDAATSQDEEPDVAAGRVFAPPRVRRLARELGVDITAVEGSGDGGTVTEADVRAAAESVAPTETAEQTGGADETTGGTDEQTGPREFTGGTAVTSPRETSAEAGPAPRQATGGRSVVRRRGDGEQPLADRATRDTSESATDTSTPVTPEPATAESQVSDEVTAVPTPPRTAGSQSTHYDEVDVTTMQASRERLAAAGVADGNMTDLAFVVAAVAAALESVPALNGPIEDGDLQRRDDVNVAIAVPTDEGLVEPVVVDADDVSLPVLAREVAELVERARDGSLAPAETADGTFTVAAFGALGGTYAAPSVDAFGTAVLALGEIRKRQRGRDDETRTVLPLSTAVDARAVEGDVPARFMTEVRRYLNTPELLLLE